MLVALQPLWPAFARNSLAILAFSRNYRRAHGMHFKALSAAVYGIDAHIIDVEVDFSGIQVAEDRFSTV